MILAAEIIQTPCYYILSRIYVSRGRRELSFQVHWNVSSRFANMDSQQLTLLSSPADSEGLVCSREIEPQNVAFRGQFWGPLRRLALGVLEES